MLDFNEYKLRENNLPDGNVTCSCILCTNKSPEQSSSIPTWLQQPRMYHRSQKKKKVVSILSFTCTSWAKFATVTWWTCSSCCPNVAEEIGCTSDGLKRAGGTYCCYFCFTDGTSETKGIDGQGASGRGTMWERAAQHSIFPMKAINQ